MAPFRLHDKDRGGYPGPGAFRSLTGSLRGGDAVRLHALLTLGRLVGYLGALVEGLEALACYARVVHEEVLATLVRGDEAVALLVGKPLYRSLGHVWSPPFVFLGLQRNKKPPLWLKGGASHSP